MKCQMCKEHRPEDEFYLYQNFVLYEYRNCQKCRSWIKRTDASGGFDEYMVDYPTFNKE